MDRFLFDAMVTIMQRIHAGPFIHIYNCVYGYTFLPDMLN